MSYTPSLSGDVKGPTANTFVQGFQGRPLDPANAPPAIGNAYIWDVTGHWTPGMPTAAPGTALAASLIFRAAGPTAGNVYATWALLYAAFQTTDGPVTIAIDTAPGGVPTATTIPAGPGPYDMQGRATIVPFSSRETAGGLPYINVLTLADGAVFINLPEISGALKVIVAPTVLANIPFTYPLVPGTPACSRLILSHGAILATAATATAPVVSAPAAATLTVELFDEATIDTSLSTGVNGVFVALGANSIFTTFGFDFNEIATQGAVPAIGYATGPATSTLRFFSDASGFGYFGPGLTGLPVAGSGYAGPAPGLTLLDFAQGVLYNPLTLPAPHPPALAIGGVLTLQAQAAIDALNINANEVNTQTVTNAVTPYTIDVTSAPIQDQTILQDIPAGGGVILLPAIVPGNHREITVKDITGTQVGSGFTVTGAGGNLVDNSPLGLAPAASLVNPAVPWNSVTFKSDGVNTWWIK